MENTKTVNELESKVKQLEAVITKMKAKQKYGLVWEDEEETVPSVIPQLIEERKLKIVNDKNKHENLLIEGDNYHSLLALQKTHLGKVDVIYIDPPYNTGNEFVYNDKIVDKEDSFRHSKWLSFMSKRLKLAKSLLSEDGVIFVSIDDNEQAQLKLLMDDIFGEQNFLTQFVWLYSRNNVKNGELLSTGANLGKIKKTKEYILSYSKNNSAVAIGRKQISEGKEIKSRITKNGNSTSTIILKKGIPSELEKGEFVGTIGGSSEPIHIEGKMSIDNYKLSQDVSITAQFGNPNIVQKLLNGEQPIDSKGQKYVSLYLTKTGLPYTIKEKNGNLYTDVISGYGGSSIGNQEIVDIFGDIEFSG